MGLPNISTLTQRFIASRQLLPGDWANAITDALTSSQTVTATPAGTQATSVLLNAAQVNITVVATANDGVKLPPALAGMEISIVNSDAADAAQIFASGSDTINATAGATGVSLAAGAAIILRCIKTGNWRRFVSA
jgi:hypothetical protein